MLELSNAKFITDTNPRASEAPLFKKCFSVDKPVASAVLYVTARGIYEAYLNGARAGKFVFAPGWTSYAKRIQVQTIDVTGLIKPKENSLELLLGNGWHCGAIANGTYDKAGERAVIACLRLTFEDGSLQETVTDESWQWAKSPVLYSDIYHGEVYDANVTPCDWKPVSLASPCVARLIPQEGEEVREIQRIPAVSLIITPKGERVIDFGQEVTGYVRFRAVGEIGSRIVLDHSEMPDKEGNFYTENYRSARSRVTYITDGNSQWYQPHFSFQGFRYIRLTEYPTNEIYLGDFEAVVVHSDLTRTGHFTCSNPMVNRLYENVIWGQKGNFLDIPTDCPQRDERLGWTGDAQVFCRTAAYNFDVNKFFKKWLRDLALDQKPDGAVPYLIPALFDTGVDSFAWSDAAVICPWEIYRAYGDTELLREQFPSMKAWVDHVDSKGTTPEEWNGSFQFGDWLGLDAEEGSCFGATSTALLSAAFFAYSTALLIKAGKALGMDMEKYERLHAFIVQSFRDNFVGEDGMLTSETHTAYVCAIKFGLAPDSKKYAARLAELIHQNGDKLKTGFIGTAYIMDALSENGFADVAYTLLLQTEFPSWLYCVRKGATTIWEHWDGLKPDGSMWSRDMNSFNHYSYGAVASWLYGTVAGIRPDEDKPGYKHILLRPIPDPRLDYAGATLDTRCGTVSSFWRKTQTGYEFDVSVPAGATATLTLGSQSIPLTPGTYKFNL